VIAVVVGVFFYPGVRSCGTNMPSEGPTELAFEFTITGGKVPDDMRTIRVWQDDTVRLRWTAGVPLVLHLHGYDIEKKVMPGRMTEIDFKAHATGRFPVAVHPEGETAATAHGEAPLVMVEVFPR
jgi:hypothetical protein